MEWIDKSQFYNFTIFNLIRVASGCLFLNVSEQEISCSKAFRY